MDFNWNYGADVDSGEGQVTPSGNASLSDYALDVGGATAGVVGTLGAGARAASEVTDSLNAAAIWRFISDVGEDLSDDAHRAMSPEAQQQLHTTVTSPEFWEHPISATILKSLDMTPAIAATVAPAMLAAPETGGASVAAAGAVLGASQSAEDVYAITDNMSDADFQKAYPYYAQLRQQGMDEDKARAKANKELMGLKPFLNAAANAGAMLMGPAGRMAGVIPEGAGAGLLKRVGVGAGEAALGNATMAATGEATHEQTQIQLDQRTQLDPSLIAAAGAEGGIEGAAMGAVGGAFTREPAPGPDLRKTGYRAPQVDARSPALDEQVALKSEQPGPSVGAGDQHPVPPPSPAAPKAPEVPPQNPPSAPLPNDSAVSPPAPPAAAPVKDEGQTVPETASTLAAQRQQLIDGQRQAMLYPKGPGAKPAPPPGMKVVNTKDGVIHYNPAGLKPKDIYAASQAGRLNDILELGPYSKQDVAGRATQGEAPVAVTERQPDGTEVKAAAGTPSTAPDQVAALEASKTPGNTVQVEPPEQVLADRMNGAPQADESASEIQTTTAEPHAALNELPPSVMAAIGRRLESIRQALEEQEAAGHPVRGGIDDMIARKRDEMIADAKGSVNDLNDEPAPAPRARAQEKGEGKHFTQKQVEERAQNNAKASEVISRFAPTDEEVANYQNPAGRQILEDRLKGMVEAAEKEGVKIPARIKDATNKQMEHNSAVALLTEAKTLMAPRKKGLTTEQYAKFISREKMLRTGDAEDRRQVLEDRRQEGEQQMKLRSKGRAAVENLRSPDEEIAAERERMEAVPDEAANPEVAAEETEEPRTETVAAGQERPRVSLAPGEGYTAVDSGRAAERAGAVKVEKKRTPRFRARSGQTEAEEAAAEARFMSAKASERPVLRSTVKGMLNAPVKTTHTLNYAISHDVMRKLREVVGNTPVHILKDHVMDAYDPRASALYDDQANMIYLRESAMKNRAALQHDIIHEAMHSATIEALKRNPEAADTVRMMMDEFDHALKNPEQFLDRYTAIGSAQLFMDMQNSKYAFTDEFEFVAEMMSNPQMQRLMGQVTISDQLRKRLGLDVKMSLKDAFVRLIRQILGIPNDSRNISMIEAALKMSDDLISDTSRYNALTQPVDMAARMQPRLRANIRPGDFTRSGNDEINGLFHEPFAAAMSRNMGEAKAAIRGYADKLIDPAKAYQTAIERAGDLGTAAQKALRYITTNDQLVNYGKNRELIPMGPEIFSTIEKAGVLSNKLKEEGIDLAAALIRAQKMNPGAFESFSRLIHDQTMVGADASTEIGQGRNRHLALAKGLMEKIQKGQPLDDVAHEAAMRAWEGRAAHPELQARYNALTGQIPEFRQLQEKLFSFYERTQSEIGKDQIESILRNYDFKGTDAERRAIASKLFNDNMTDAERADLVTNIGENAVSSIEGVDALKVKNGPYAPLMRRGDHAVLGVYKVEPPAGGHQIDDNTWEFKSRKEAHDFATKNGLHSDTKIVYYDSATGQRVKAKSDAISTAGGPEQRFQVKLQRQHLEFHETAADARASMEELKKSGLFEKLGLEERRNLEHESNEFTGRGVDALLRSLANQDKYKDMSELEKGVLRHTIREAGLRAMSDNRVQSRRLPRRYVQGASDDVARNLIDYNHSQANYRAKLKYREQIADLTKQMWDHVAANRYTPDNLDRSRLANEIERRVQAQDPNQNTGAWSSWTRRLMTWSYIDRMMRPSHLILHQTHLPMITAPYMAGRHGLGRSFGETMRAWKQLTRFYNAGAHDAFVSAMGSPLQKFSDYAELAKRSFAEQSDAVRLGKMLDSLNEDGIIHPSMGQEVDKYVPSKQATGLVGGVDRGLSKLDTVFRQLTNSTEAINRIAGATAAYRLEYGRLTREGKSSAAAHDAAVEYARRTLADTQGRFSATNNAPLFKNPIIRPFLQFKQFPQMMYHLLGKLTVQALKGETKQAKVEAMASLASILGMHMMMAGVLQGLPLEPFKLLGLISKGIGLTQGDWSDVEQAVTRSINANFGTTVGHLLTRGVGAQLGVDVHHRLGLNSFITYGMPEQLDSKNVSDFLMNAIGGAPYGMAKDALGGINKMMNGDVEGGALQAMPLQALRDIHNAVNPAPNKYGYTPTAADRIKSVLGFTPEAKYVASQKKEAIYNAIQDYDQQRSNFIKQWTSASPDARQGVWSSIQSWNQGLPQASRLTKGDLYKALSRLHVGDASGRSLDSLRVNRQTRPIAQSTADVYQ